MTTGQKAFLGGLAVLAVAGGAYALLRRQPRPQPAPVVKVQTGATDVWVRYDQVALDLHHLEQGDGFRYHGTVVV